MALLLFLCAATVAAEEIYPGYSWEEVGEGIYLHRAVDPLAGPVDGNSVVIINDRDVFVVDTHINPAVARAVIARLASITDKPVTHIINTHWHDDHSNGNQAWRVAWPEAKIIAHRASLAAMQREWEPMLKQRREAYAALTPPPLLDMANKLEPSDPVQAWTIRVYADYVAALKPELPNLEAVYPDTVFDDELVFERGDRRIQLRWLGRGNTDGDAVVWLPDDKLLVTGDLLVYPIPFAFDSPMKEWPVTLEKARALGAATIIPGHGPVQRDNEYLKQVAALLRDTLDAVTKAREQGARYDRLPQAVDLSAQEKIFTGGVPEKSYAWKSYFIDPGLKSAWQSLGYPVPAD